MIIQSLCSLAGEVKRNVVIFLLEYRADCFIYIADRSFLSGNICKTKLFKVEINIAVERRTSHNCGIEEQRNFADRNKVKIIGNKRKACTVVRRADCRNRIDVICLSACEKRRDIVGIGRFDFSRIALGQKSLHKSYCVSAEGMTDKIYLFDMSVFVNFAPALNHRLGICSAETGVVVLLRVSDAVINR